MYFPFRSRGRESSRELEKDNSMRELACNDPRDNRCPGTRTNLLLLTFLLLRERKELRGCISRDLSS